jgi:cytochrome c-type biogenesis protein CcmH/NrfG
MADTDQDLINQVDEMDRREQETRREAERMRNRRLNGAIWGVFGVLVLGLLWGSVVVMWPLWQEYQAAQALAAADRHEAQEQAWKACVFAIGIERCNLIEERLAERCLEQDASGMSKCLKAEIEDR